MPEVIGNLEELTAVILRAAQQKALNEEAEARRNAGRILEQAQAEAQQIREHILAQARKRAEEERRRVLAQATLEAQRQHLQTRENLLNRVWAEAEQRLRALPQQPEYMDVLRRLALLAAQTLGGNRIILAADARGHDLLTPKHLAAWSAEAQVTFQRAAEPAPIWGGLIATHENGRQQVDASFATRLALARQVLRERIAAILEIT